MIIFTPTVPHTGTWFVINFLSNFIPNFREASQILRDEIVIDEPTILHTHFAPRKEWYNGCERREKIKQLPIDSICLLASIHKTVIPVRDPLAAILTREARHPEHRHFHIVDGFIHLAARLSNNRNVKFLPIDLPVDMCQRWKILSDIVDHCGLERNEEIIEDYADRWPPQNETPGNLYKKLYKEKDAGGIEFMLGPKMAEIQYLKNQASIILPFLASLGYTKGDLNLW